MRTRVKAGLSLTGSASHAMAWVLAFGRSLGALEINPDIPWKRPLPPHPALLLHSLKFSLFRRDFDLEDWCRSVKQNVKGQRPAFFTVHYGADWFKETRVRTFLPLSPSPLDIDLACDRLKYLSDQFLCPVGIENLALALSREDCVRQIEVIETIRERVDGYLLLDLHNIYCQSVNFGPGLSELLGWINRERVLEVHISGGSLYKGFRRDTHDGEVPEEIWSHLPEALASLPNLRWALFEQLPSEFIPDLLLTTNAFRRLLPILEALKSTEAIAPGTPPIQTSEDVIPDPRALEVRDLLVRKWKI